MALQQLFREHFEQKIIENGSVKQDFSIDKMNKNGKVIQVLKDNVHDNQYIYNNHVNKFRKISRKNRKKYNSIFANKTARMPIFGSIKKRHRKSKKNRVLVKRKES
jgi:hypothetical protein